MVALTVANAIIAVLILYISFISYVPAVITRIVTNKLLFVTLIAVAAHYNVVVAILASIAFIITIVTIHERDVAEGFIDGIRDGMIDMSGGGDEDEASDSTQTDITDDDIDDAIVQLDNQQSTDSN